MPDAAEMPAALLCPQCGYDLRMLASDRCPECGLAMDEEIDQKSRLPWAYRVANGHVLSYLKTVWLVSFRPARFAAEIGRPTSLRDARRFWVISSVFITLPLIGLMVWRNLMTFDPLSVLSIPRFVRMQFQNLPAPWQLAITWDFGLPLKTGWQILPLAIVVLFATVLACFQVLPMLLNRPGIPLTQRARAVALAHYAVGPMVWWPICMAVAAVVALIPASNPSAANLAERETYLVVGSAFFSFGACFLLTWIRSCSIYTAFRRGGWRSRLIAAVAVPLGWSLCLIFWLLAVPWAFGLLWIYGRLL